METFSKKCGSFLAFFFSLFASVLSLLGYWLRIYEVDC
jgi:hypothetical protein